MIVHHASILRNKRLLFTYMYVEKVPAAGGPEPACSRALRGTLLLLVCMHGCDSKQDRHVHLPIK